jgi:hypothetical protein
MYTTAGTPVTWLIDRFVPGSMRRAHVARAAAAYLAHLLATNSHRVENDFRDRARESRRWLEGQIRARLASALRSAERAVTVAVDKPHLSEADLNAALHRLQELHSEIRDECVTSSKIYNWLIVETATHPLTIWKKS